MDKKWQKILDRHPESNFLQSPIWAEVNKRLGHQVLVECFDDEAVVMMIIKKARRGKYLEIPGGPILDWNNTELIKKVFTQIKEIAKEHKCVFVRFRPQLKNTAENLEKISRTGSRVASFHLHAQHTVILDLSRAESEILSSMRRQTRYEVRKSEKLGLKVTRDNSIETFKKFHKVQLETARRQNFIPPKLEELMAYRDSFGENINIYTAKTKSGEDIAYALLMTYGREAEYFEAASTKLNRKLPGAYAIQWQIIKDLKKRGILRYNLWGIAPEGAKNHRYSGVTTFKTGFGGSIVEFVSARDIVIDKVSYLKVYLIETIRKKRRKL